MIFICLNIVLFPDSPVPVVVVSNVFESRSYFSVEVWGPQQGGQQQGAAVPSRRTLASSAKRLKSALSSISIFLFFFLACFCSSLTSAPEQEAPILCGGRRGSGCGLVSVSARRAPLVLPGLAGNIYIYLYIYYTHTNISHPSTHARHARTTPRSSCCGCS